MFNFGKLKIAIIFIAVIFSLISSTFVVFQTEQAILLQFGKIVSKSILLPGLHFKIPLIQKDLHFDKRMLGFSSVMREAIASDQKRVLVDTYTKYVIDNPLLFYQSVRNERNLISRASPIVESITREAIAKVTLSCFIGECRENTVNFIRKNTEDAVKSFGIKIVDVRIKTVGLPNENIEAIFSRMITDREKEAKEIRSTGFQEKSIIMSLADKESSLILSGAQLEASTLRGKADAEAAEIYSAAFSKDLEYFNYLRYLEMYRKTIDKKDTIFMIDENNKFLKFLLKN